MEEWWETDALDVTIDKIMRANLKQKITGSWRMRALTIKAVMLNLQAKARSGASVEAHYDIGNDLYTRMLDPRMVYTCAYWDKATNLVEAQEGQDCSPVRGPIRGRYIQRQRRPIVVGEDRAQERLGIVQQARRARDTGTAARLLVGCGLGLPDEVLLPAFAALDNTGRHEALHIAHQVNHARPERGAQFSDMPQLCMDRLYGPVLHQERVHSRVR